MNQSLMDAWKEAVGPTLAEHTRIQSLTDGCLFVVVPSEKWAEQLALYRWRIAERINHTLGEDEVVEFLEFVVE